MTSDGNKVTPGGTSATTPTGSGTATGTSTNHDHAPPTTGTTGHDAGTAGTTAASPPTDGSHRQQRGLTTTGIDDAPAELRRRPAPPPIRLAGMDEHLLRRATEDDVRAIEALVADAFGKYVERIGKPPAPMIADYAGLLGESRIWVLESRDADRRRARHPAPG